MPKISKYNDVITLYIKHLIPFGLFIRHEGAVPRAPKVDELKFKTKEDGYVNIHPSSVNFQVRHYDSPYLVYHEKLKTSKVRGSY